MSAAQQVKAVCKPHSESNIKYLYLIITYSQQSVDHGLHKPPHRQCDENRPGSNTTRHRLVPLSAEDIKHHRIERTYIPAVWCPGRMPLSVAVSPTRFGWGHTGQMPPQITTTSTLLLDNTIIHFHGIWLVTFSGNTNFGQKYVLQKNAIDLKPDNL